MATSRESAALELRGLRRRYPSGGGVFGPSGAGVDLAVRAGTTLAIVGPSGCGKSTLLRLVAGLERPDAGTVLIGGRDVTTAAPSDRGVGVTFDDGALYEHLTVRANLDVAAGPLNRSERSDAVAEAIRLTGVERFLDRRPGSLSAGERRRAALARAVARRPSILLLDEPLTHLDRRARLALREDLSSALQVIGATALIVTHDHDDALALAPTVAFMQGGTIRQVGSPFELRDAPADIEVAAGFGLTPMNVVQETNGAVGVRPDDLRLGPPPDAGAWSASGVVSFVTGNGVTVRLANGDRVRLQSMSMIGTRVTIWAPLDRIIRFDAEGRRNSAPLGGNADIPLP